MSSTGPLAPADAVRLAERCAREGGAILRARFGRPVEGEGTKSSATDPVSDADRASEAAIVGLLRAERPADALDAEEGSALGDGSSGVRWAVDPLDGTVNYLFGIPHWSVVVAASDARGTLAGVVYDPLRDELFRAVRGEGAWLDRPGAPGLRLRASERADVALALAATGFSYATTDRALQARVLDRVLPAVRDIRRLGSAALDLAWVAAGRYDCYFESVTNPWDWLAGALCVVEAGGRVTVRPTIRSGEPRVVASGAALHAPLLALLDAAVQDSAESLDLP